METGIYVRLSERDAGADAAVNQPEMIQETLRMIADSTAMWNRSPAQRVSCWLAVDEMLRGLKPQELVPLRGLQERRGGSLIRQLSLSSGVQIVDASAGTGPGRKAASLGISWNGGPGGLGPNDRVGAEVAGGCWYVISPDRQNDLYSKTHIAGGYQNPAVYLDVFDRNTGALLRTQKAPIAPRDRRLGGYDNQAAILDDVLIVADQRSVQVFRTMPTSLPQ